MLTRKRDRVRTDFVHAMESRFHVRNARVELIGSFCLKVVQIKSTFWICVGSWLCAGMKCAIVGAKDE